ncbi:IE-1 [Plodia interpunctella granulovirus]|uniref:IE-1 n=1 Tax=Plodia interpunctella granulovirus TaxID=262175 RepID=A0A1L5JHF1_9BBAC|nr:IE-1 [Plodia interpunctella granulovirus]APO13890.1 IE-1 [Plodia interpunctella granulovirus]
MEVESEEEEILRTNDSEEEEDEDKCNADDCPKPDLVPPKKNWTKSYTARPIKPPPTASITHVDTFKWLNRFITTTSHMFVCHDTLEYIRNERYPSDVYKNAYLKLYGNAYELFIRDCKFYITTFFLNNHHEAAEWYPQEEVVKQTNYDTISTILHLTMRDGQPLLYHILEAMHHTLFIGITTSDVLNVKNMINQEASFKKGAIMKKRYSWKSEERKIPAVVSTSTDSVQDMFSNLYKYDTPKFITQELSHELYIKDFERNILNLKKPITDYVDCVSNLRLLTKDFATVLYNSNSPNLQHLANVDGSEADVEEFLQISLKYIHGDIFWNMKKRDMKRQRCRLTCFKMQDVYVWVNGLVYDKKSRFQLESLIDKYKMGTHHILTFDYVYNTKLNGLHGDTVRLVIRYILSRRSFELLQKDIVVCNKLSYKKMMPS